jgi:hypothetical protein
MALSFHENQSKTAGPAKSGGTQTARRMLFVSQGKPALQGNDVVLRAKDRGRGMVLRGRRLPDPKTSGRRMGGSLRY